MNHIRHAKITFQLRKRIADLNKSALIASKSRESIGAPALKNILTSRTGATLFLPTITRILQSKNKLEKLKEVNQWTFS